MNHTRITRLPYGAADSWEAVANADSLEVTRWPAQLDEGGLPGPEADRRPRAETARVAPPAVPLVYSTGRAAIGDQLRKPIAWCEAGSCGSLYEDPAALGEADIRARAIAAGWHEDAVGLLACPACKQRHPWFRATQLAVLSDRKAAITRTGQVAAAAYRDDEATSGTGAETDAIPAIRSKAISWDRSRGRHRSARWRR